MYLVESLGFKVAFVLHLGAVVCIGIHAALVVVDNFIESIQPIVLADVDGIVERLVVKVPQVLVVSSDERLTETESESQFLLKAMLIRAITTIRHGQRRIWGLVIHPIQGLQLDEMRTLLDEHQYDEAQGQQAQYGGKDFLHVRT